MDDATPADPGTLYVVATPIGNLSDITHRAIRILSAVDLVVAEDTRRARKLLAHLDLQKEIESLHEHSSDRKIRRLLDILQSGGSIALTTDSGVPTISDPGSQLVAAAWNVDLTVIPVPGPSAVSAALSVSGFRADQFRFAGYPPRKSPQRRTFYAGIARSEVPVVVFEAPHRIKASLEDAAAELSPHHPVVVAREITKQFEEIKRGELQDITRHYMEAEAVGEFTLVFDQAPVVQQREQRESAADESRLTQLLAETPLPTKTAAEILSEATGMGRNEAYQRLLDADAGD